MLLSDLLEDGIQFISSLVLLEIWILLPRIEDVNLGRGDLLCALLTNKIVRGHIYFPRVSLEIPPTPHLFRVIDQVIV